MLEFITGIFGNLVSGWLAKGGNFLLEQVGSGSVELEEWKAKRQLTKSDNDFLVRFAEALIATLDSQEKRDIFGPFFRTGQSPSSETGRPPEFYSPRYSYMASVKHSCVG